MDEDPDVFREAGEVPDVRYYRMFGRSGRLPFRDASFDLILCHHVLEHITAPEAVLREIARVLKPDGRLYVAVPNGYGLCDAVYRYVFEGGGHVNRFARRELAALIESVVGARLARWQKLYSSFAYLQRLTWLLAAPPPDLSPRLHKLGRFPRAITAARWLLYLGTRAADRLFHTDLAVYGWALYFDRTAQAPIEDSGYANVCMYCGTGHHAQAVMRMSWFRCLCRKCNRTNPFVRPFRNTR